MSDKSASFRLWRVSARHREASRVGRSRPGTWRPARRGGPRQDLLGVRRFTGSNRDRPPAQGTPQGGHGSRPDGDGCRDPGPVPDADVVAPRAISAAVTVTERGMSRGCPGCLGRLRIEVRGLFRTRSSASIRPVRRVAHAPTGSLRAGRAFSVASTHLRGAPGGSIKARVPATTQRHQPPTSPTARLYGSSHGTVCGIRHNHGRGRPWLRGSPPAGVILPGP